MYEACGAGRCSVNSAPGRAHVLLRYVHQTTVDQCDFIVDLHLADQAEEPYSASPDWEVVWSAPFLDAARSPTLTRAFFVPKLVQRNVYASYEVLQRKVVQSVPAPVSGRRRRQRVSSEEEADELEFVPTPASDLDAEL